MKAHVAKPTQGIKMPQHKTVQSIKPAPKQHTDKAPTAKRLTSTPGLKLPTIPQHREKLATLAPSGAKKGKA